jgi:hypothetical protein
LIADFVNFSVKKLLYDLSGYGGLALAGRHLIVLVGIAVENGI